MIAQPSDARPRARILLVEDDPADIRLTLEMFGEGKLNPEIDVVRDGIEALRYLRGEPGTPAARRPELILLDLNLPRMDGRELLAMLKADPEFAAIPVVVLTTSVAPQDVAHCRDLAAAGVYRKPVDLKSFQLVVRTIEERWQALVGGAAR